MTSLAKFALLSALMGLAPGGAWRARAATLFVKIENVSPKGGDIRIAIYNRASYSGHDQNAVADKVVRAVFPETAMRFDDLSPGIYAIKLFQDVNRNGRFDMSWIGIPEEPFGFSNDARPILDQPSFGATKFELRNTRTITIHLQRWFATRNPEPSEAQRQPRAGGWASANGYQFRVTSLAGMC
jgi:uncharacterized protein (DUF2141 family)